jgi:hypothetical protein
MVWSEPMLRVAARFGVSSSHMARVCTLLNVPRPERGYWAKLAVGKAPKCLLSDCETLDDGDPAEFGEQHRALQDVLPNLRVIGGCCGTDHRHMAAVASACC